MSGKRLAALGCGDLCGEVLDRMHSTDQNVAKGLTARFRVIKCIHRRGDSMVWRRSHGVDQGHRFPSTTGRRNNRLAIRVLLEVPFGQRLVVPAFAGREKPRGRIGLRLG